MTDVLPGIPLLNCFATTLEFGDAAFEIFYCNFEIKIYADNENYAVVKLKNQQVPYKANILGGFAFNVETVGTCDFKKYFDFVWQDDLSVPELSFVQKPARMERKYDKGQKIELGVEAVKGYHVIYQDGVTADFINTGDSRWEFSFSTGFEGSFKKEEDGSYSIRFKEVRRDADEDGYRSESKFIISRSKYTNNLLLILQDEATVHLKLY